MVPKSVPSWKEPDMSRRLITIRAICQRYGDICTRTADRWLAAGVLPEPMRINGIRYWDLDELEEIERERMAKAIKTVETA
jgi:hypothetical protein